eukprot:gb/GECH01009345.1/.p1 GENE.gb/GECH01009345.1/~~gb/GECH01009345.1/.p1  ORF type:complete len:288 (+),score=52.25 gb/GECH01009345.1/:1-864(+)
MDDPESWKWINIATESSSGRFFQLEFVQILHAGTPTFFNIADRGIIIYRYKVPKESLQMKLYFHSSSDSRNLKFHLFDGKKSVPFSQPFTKLNKYTEDQSWFVLELETAKLSHEYLYIELITRGGRQKIKALAVEVVSMNAKYDQIKELSIDAAGYRVFNISIPSDFSHVLLLKCEPHQHSDPDLIASVEDLTTHNMTSNARVTKTRLGKDQMGLSLEDGEGMLQQGYFFLAVFRYNATWFAFDINALGAPQGLMKIYPIASGSQQLESPLRERPTSTTIDASIIKR